MTRMFSTVKNPAGSAKPAQAAAGQEAALAGSSADRPNAAAPAAEDAGVSVREMMEYMKRELQGKCTVRGAVTFREIFGNDLQALEKEWLDYVDSITTAGIKEGMMY